MSSTQRGIMRYVFAVHAQRKESQVKRAPGFLRGGLLPDRDWTLLDDDAWGSQESMAGYITTGAPMKAMRSC